MVEGDKSGQQVMGRVLGQNTLRKNRRFVSAEYYLLVCVTSQARILRPDVLRLPLC